MPTPLNTPLQRLAAISAFVLTLGGFSALHAADAPPASDNVISLAGDWRFAMDRDDAGYAAGWFNTDLTDKIKLPGILQAQGYGDDIAMDTPWVAALGANSWRNNPELTKYTQPGDVRIPFLIQPPKHYLGVAWYQRDIEIPASWAGKRVELFLERAHWQTTAWVDGTPFAYADSRLTRLTSDADPRQTPADHPGG